MDFELGCGKSGRSAGNTDSIIRDAIRCDGANLSGKKRKKQGGKDDTMVS
jgi:hypothetical protein